MVKMFAGQADRERIGEMLVALGLVTRAQLSEALAAQRASPGPLGKHLVGLGYVSEAQLTQVLSNQLSVPWVSLERVRYSEALLARIPGAIADRYCVMPVYLRSVRGQGETLYVAMDDPTDAAALRQVEAAAGVRVRPMIAAPSEIRRAIERRYFGGPGESMRPEVLARGGRFGDETTGPVRRPQSAARARAEAEKRKPAKAPPPPPRKPQTPPNQPPLKQEQEGAVPLEQYALPSKPPVETARTLTLLDGTKIKLPAGGPSRAAKPVTEVRHAVKAVASASADLGIDGPLKWHDIVQAVIDAANARGVTLARREIAEAWARNRLPPEGTASGE